MNLHRVLMLYYGFLMQIFIISGDHIQFSNENSTQIETKNITLDVKNKENNSYSTQLQSKKLKLNFVKNEKQNCTKNFHKRHIRDILLKRRKRLLTFPQDTAFKCTLTLTKALISTIPRGLNLFYEWDAFYQVPDTLEKWKPTHEPEHHHHHIEISDKDPKPPHVPESVSTTEPIPPPVPNDDDNIKDNDNAMDDHNDANDMMMDNMMDNMMNNDNNDDNNTKHDHDGDSWKDDYNKYWSSESFPNFPHGDSGKIYPTPPPGWMNDDDNNTKNIDILSLHPDVPPSLPSSQIMDNNDSSANTNDDQTKNDEKLRKYYKLYDSRNNWNRKYSSLPMQSYHRYLNYPQFPNYNYQKPIQENYYYKNYQRNFPMKWNQYQYQQQPYNINWKQSFVPSKVLQSWGKRRNNNSNKWYEWYDHRGHRERRHIYDELEKYGLLFGFTNIRYCIFRTICEVRNYLLPRGVSLIHDIIRVIFTLPYKEHWSDDYINEVRTNKKNCRLAFQKTCPFSILEYALFSNQNNIKNNIKIS